jgi:uncharacterized membrane protein YeaQ/YmgE (transglycosylase-associated protein family)
MHGLDVFLLSVVKLMLLPGFVLGAAWSMRAGAGVLASLALGTMGGLAGSLALAGIVATLKLEAWRGAASVYVIGSLLGALIVLALVAKRRG